MIIFSTDSLMNSHPWNYDKYRMINQGYIWGTYEVSTGKKRVKIGTKISTIKKTYLLIGNWYQGMFPV